MDLLPLSWMDLLQQLTRTALRGNPHLLAVRLPVVPDGASGRVDRLSPALLLLESGSTPQPKTTGRNS